MLDRPDAGTALLWALAAARPLVLVWFSVVAIRLGRRRWRARRARIAYRPPGP